MEYRIFGAGRQPHDQFVPDLQAFCELDDIQREALAVWFESTSDFDAYTPELPPGILASTLLPAQFRKTATVIGSLLNAWHQRSLQIVDIERDLLLLGFSPEHIQLVSGFLQRLSPIRERIWRDGREGDAQVYGLPTLDDVNIFWDARAVFGGPTYYYFDADADDATYKQFLGLTCMAVLEFMVSDAGGLKQRIAIQMNETVFRALLRAINRADDQLGSLKALIEPLSVAPKSVKG